MVEYNQTKEPLTLHEIRTGRRTPDSEALPGVGRSARLAEPTPDNGAMQLAAKVTEKVDESTSYIVHELDQLIKEIEAIKKRVVDDAALVVRAIQDHLELGAEALAFTTKVRQRLDNGR